MTVELLPPVRWWACPNCPVRDQTQRPDVHTQMHQCQGMNGLLAPLVEVPTADSDPDARNRLVSREDGPGLAALVTDHGDGSNDVTVFADTAYSTAEGVL